MAINHEVTKKLTITVKEYIDEFAALLAKLNVQRSEINNDGFISQKGKEQKLNELVSEYKPKANALVDKIVDALERISASEQMNENYIDPENNALNNAVEIVDRFGNNLPLTIANSYVKYFAGYKKALEILQTAFEKNGIHSSNISKYIINIEPTYSRYIDLANSLILDNVSRALQFIQLYNEIFKTAERLGVEFTEQEKATKINFDDVFGRELARKAMGLS